MWRMNEEKGRGQEMLRIFVERLLLVLTQN